MQGKLAEVTVGAACRALSEQVPDIHCLDFLTFDVQSIFVGNDPPHLLTQSGPGHRSESRRLPLRAWQHQYAS